MSKYSSRAVSLLMIFTLLLSMMTAVTVSAETTEWMLVKEFTFEGETPLDGLDQTTNATNKEFEVIKDTATNSMVAHLKYTTDNVNHSRMFNILDVVVSVGDEFKLEYDVKAKFVDTATEFKWTTAFFAGGTTSYSYFTNKQATAEWQSHSTELRAAYNPVKEEALLTNPYNCQMGLNLNGQAIGDEVWIDNVKLYKKVSGDEPVLKEVTIDGTPQVGQTLTAKPVFKNGVGDETAIYSYQWQVKNTTWKNITGATAKTYKLEDESMVGKQVRVVVLSKLGITAASEETQTITAAAVTPPASGEAIDWVPVKTVDFENITKTGADSKRELDFIIYARANSYECVVDETGSKVLHLVGPSSGTTMNFFIRDVPVEKGTVYKAVFRAKAKRNASITDPMRLILYTGSYYLTPHGTLTDQWQTIERNGNADGYTGETTAAGALSFANNPANGTTAVQSDDELWIDDIVLYKKVTLVAPVVKSIVIDGAAQIGQTLTANAVVTDANEGDTASASYQWQVKNDDWENISGATAKTYKIEDEGMLGKQLRVVVTPLSDNEKDPAGTPVPSDATQVITTASIPPSGKEQKVEGTFEIGQELTASFVYVPSESGVEKGEAEYIWETSENEAFAEGSVKEVQKGKNNKYIVGMGDAGKWLRVRIIPKDKNGVPGDALIVTAKQVKGEISLYVSNQKGDDANDGSKDKPFKTIQKARDTIRTLDTLPLGGITVNIMGGTYPVDQTITFTAEDSGTEESPIVYQAYNNEKVFFIGGKTLDSSKIKKVTDKKVLDGLVEEDAKDHLYMLDLGEQDVTMDPVQPYGSGFTRDTEKEKVKRIYMNNQLLTDARWPNDDQSQNLLVAIPVTKEQNADVAAGKLNAAGTPIMYGYPDPENRSAKWNIKEGDAIVGGAVVYYWAQTYLRIKSLDAEKKIVTSIDKSSYGSVSDAGWGGQCKIFFSNLFAEIDKPGESYIDRENNILYFYPIGSVKDAEMVVSTLKKNMISLNEVSYVTFKGIDFKNTAESAIKLYDCDHVTIADAEISNITQSGIEMTNATNTVIEECNFYNIGLHGVKITGDDALYKAPTSAEKLATIPENRRTLTASGNEIRYNNFHNVNTMQDYKHGAIYIEHAVGEWIHHNEFNDIDVYTIRIEASNDILIEYNKLMNLGSLNSDAGAINWGREFNSLGHTVRYNYFENIGSKLVSNHLLGHQSVSIFMDDATTGGNIHGNVFFNGGSNQLGVGAPVIGNGPEFSNVWGNISICTDFDRMRYTFVTRNWSTLDGLKNTYGITYADVNKDTAIGSWVYHMGMRDAYGQASSSTASQAAREMMWLDSWEEHYKDTQWAPAITHYSKENYEGAKKLYDAEDYKGVLLYLSDALQKQRTNKIHNNVSLGAVEEHPQSLSFNHYSDNYYGTQHAITEEDKALFVDFDNKDFTLTDAGLAKIKTKAPEFEAINFKDIGFGDKAIGGHKPVVTVKPENISGVAKAGYTISAAYIFTDADGDAEGNTKIYWHISEEEDGKYKPIYGGDESKKNEFGGVEGKKFEILDDYTGKYLKYEIVPADTTSLRGETVWSDPIFVSAAGAADVSELSDKITAAIAMVNDVVAGEEVGQYPQSEIDKLNALILEAQTLANDPGVYQYQVDAMLEKLTVGVQTFEASVISSSEFVSIAGLLEDEDGWTQTRGTGTTLEDGVLTLSAGTTFAYTAEKFDNQIFVFKMKIEEANTEDDVDPIINNSVAFRKTNADAYTYTPDVYLWWFKNYQEDESQRQNEAQFRSKIPETNQTNNYLDEFKNNLIELDKEYTIGVGAYDVAGEGVKWVLYVDDMTEPVFERTYSKAEDQGILYGKDGYFMFGNDGTDIVTKIYAVKSADVAKLTASVKDAKALLENEGDAYGQYPASYIASLKNAIAKAEELCNSKSAVQEVVDETTENLNTLINSVKVNANTKMDVTKKGEATINYELPEAEFNVKNSVTNFTLQLDPEKEQPAYKFTFEGKDGTVVTEIAKGATLSADGWDGTFDLPVLGTTPSKELIGDAYTVLSMGEKDNVIASSEIVKIVLPGMAGKSLAYLQEDGSYKIISKNKNLSENTLEAAKTELKKNDVVKVNDGEDMVIYTTILTEFVAYNWKGTPQSPIVTPTPDNQPPITGGTTINGIGGGGISGVSGNQQKNEDKTKVRFTDINGHWAETDINEMADKGIVSGVTATTFEPDRSITRAEFATLIARALKLTVANDDSVFSDVSSDAWYKEPVSAAAAAGLIVGYDGNFRPNDTITREEMAVVIMKAYQFLGNAPLKGKLSQFADKDSISDWAVEYVDGAVSSGLISGMTSDTFAPQENATRAQVASLIKRLLNS